VIFAAKSNGHINLVTLALIVLTAMRTVLLHICWLFTPGYGLLSLLLAWVVSTFLVIQFELPLAHAATAFAPSLRQAAVALNILAIVSVVAIVLGLALCFLLADTALSKISGTVHGTS
jgi:hypothetical protein